MKKCFVIGLMMALIPNFGAFAAKNTVSMLMAEKEAKMKKLQSCQGTTKNLKIAGLSTLGVTAVGIGANIAEAVVLNDYDNKVKKEQAEYDKQLALKKNLEDQAAAKERERQQQQWQQNQQNALKEYCLSLGAFVAPWGNACLKEISDEVQYADVANVIKEINANCEMINFQQVEGGLEQKLGKYPLVLARCGNDIDVNVLFKHLKCPENQEFDFTLGVNKCVDKADANKDGNKDDDKGGKKGGNVGPVLPKQCGDNQELIDGECKDINNQPEATEKELFRQACTNVGYEWYEYKTYGAFCWVCGSNIGTASIPKSKAYVDNALITAVRKINVGCTGTIYTEQDPDNPGTQDSYIDCVGGRLLCFHTEINEKATTEEQAKALLQDIDGINGENYWKEKLEKDKEKDKQVKVPYRPTEEQAEQPVPTVSFKSKVQKNIERAKEIISNEPVCKDDEYFNYVMNACVKKSNNMQNEAPKPVAPAQPAAPVQQPEQQQGFWPTNIQTKQNAFYGMGF